MTPTRRIARKLLARIARSSASQHSAATLAAVFLAASALVVLAVTRELRAQALRNAEAEAEAVLHRNLALHAYLNQQLKPAVFPLAASGRAEVPFDPTWMSSTYAVRMTNALDAELGGEHASRYKECAVDARSPSNEADAHEREFLERAAADPSLVSASFIREIDGSRHLVVMRRGETIERDCLRCHGDPADAPEGLVRAYGASRSFFRREGELASAVSVRIPVEAAYARATSFAIRLSLTLLVGLAAALGVHFLLQRRFLLAPVRRLARSARVLARAPASLEPLPLPLSRELRVLTRVFNATAASVTRRREHLERAVEDRTRALRAQEERYRSVVTALSEGLVIHDPQGVVVYANPAAPRILGVSPGALLGTAAARLFPRAADEDGIPLEPSRVPPVEALRTGARVVDVITAFERPDGTTGWVSVRAVPFPWDDGSARNGLVTTFADVADRRALMARLALDDRLASLETVTAGIAHELNNPLASVSANLSYIARELAQLDSAPEHDEVRAAAAEASEGAARMRAIVWALTRFACPAEPAARAAVDLVGELSVAAKLTAHRVRQVGRLVVDVPESLPRVLAREHELGQVFSILIANAADALPPERSGSNVVRVTASSGGGAVAVVVEDNGCGIPARILPRVFDPFFTTKPVGAGMGLGLSVCHGIVRALGGHVEVATGVEVGTRVRVVLPVAHAADDPDAPPEATCAPPPPRSRGRAA